MIQTDGSELAPTQFDARLIFTSQSLFHQGNDSDLEEQFLILLMKESERSQSLFHQGNDSDPWQFNLLILLHLNPAVGLSGKFRLISDLFLL